jgi:2-methylfumaryl-CoA isomerase
LGVARPTAAPILQGFQIVELSAFVAVPLAGATLAALGADVVRVDPPSGGPDRMRWPVHAGRSLYWAGLNQGKRSATIDTRTQEGQELVTALIAKAGAVVTNLPVSDWNRYERLREHRNDLVMAVLTGTSDGSPAVDYTVNAAVGYPLVTGPATLERPVNHVLPAWDALAGYLLVGALVAAELHRVLTGAGQLIESSLMDVALSVAGNLGVLAEAQLVDEPRPRLGNDLYGSYARDFRTADQRDVIVVALTGRQWSNLVRATGITEAVVLLEAEHEVDLHVDAARYELRAEISGLVEPWIGARSLAEVREAFDAAGVLWGLYQTFQQLVADDPRCTPANPLFAELDEEGVGRYLHARPALSFSGAADPVAATAPELGADTREVLASWLGMSAAEIDEHAAAGRIGNC